jgi:aspartate/methionine/tyrosine aminotransferase
MLINSGVLCVPGSGFGCPGYFRSSLVHNQDVIEQAAKRIAEFKNQIISIS